MEHRDRRVRYNRMIRASEKTGFRRLPMEALKNIAEFLPEYIARCSKELKALLMIEGFPFKKVYLHLQNTREDCIQRYLDLFKSRPDTLGQFNLSIEQSPRPLVLLPHIVANDHLQHLTVAYDGPSEPEYTEILTNLIASNSSSLKKLTVTFTTASHLTSFGVALQSNQRLQELDIGAQLKQSDMAAIGRALAVNRTLKSLAITTLPVGLHEVSKGLRQNKHLKGLQLRLLGITPDSCFNTFVVGLEQNDTLESLHIVADYQELHGSFLGDALLKNRGLEVLILQGLINVSQIDSVVRALCVNSVLKELHMEELAFNYNFLFNLAWMLKVNSSLRLLNMRHSSIDRDDWVGRQAIIEAWSSVGESLRVNRGLRNIIFEESNLCDEAIVKLGKALVRNKNLEELTLKSNSICDEGIEALCEALSRSSQLQYLDLEFTNKGNRDETLGSNGGVALGRALRYNSGLKSLNIVGQLVNKRGGVAIGAALAISRHLQDLDLSLNNLGNTGAIAVGEALKTNRSLQRLIMRQNDIMSDGIVPLCEALRSNTVLKELALDQNYIDHIGADALRQALMENYALEGLSLSENKLGARGTEVLCEGLRENKGIKYLNLAENELGPEGAEALASALKENDRLWAVDFKNNKILEHGENAIDGALNVNRALQRIQWARDMRLERRLATGNTFVQVQAE